MKKPYWGCDTYYEYGMILVFAKNKQEAKMLTYKHFPSLEIEYINVRVRRAEDKWMALYDGSDYIDSYEGDYETWDEYWNWEVGQCS